MRKQITLLMLALTLAFPTPMIADSINTVSITAKTAAGGLSCIRWRPIGVCFWLRCSWSGCRIRTSLKVGHYNPDLVVSSYNELGGNPWTEMRATLGTVQKTTAGTLLTALLGVNADSAGNRTEGSNREHRNMVYREVDAIGHPVSSLSSIATISGLICPSQTTSFMPYFQSAFDALSWRTEIPEALYPASIIPGMREIGSWPIQSWGGVYPRTGWTTQAEEPKAAAIVAQRAGDIVTRNGQPHVYVPVSGTPSFSGRVWPPGALYEKNSRTGDWQMLTPNTETSCSTFGTNDLVTVSGWGGGKVDSGGEYAWNLWRPYKCCRRRGQWFLFSVDWMAYP
ncbi:MAG: TIGR03756 family integrating conjugative element protein [Candidatus Sedimenticola sp. (ex Thyasira tokunagai)]